jgi:hypothetical protein
LKNKFLKNSSLEGDLDEANMDELSFLDEIIEAKKDSFFIVN